MALTVVQIAGGRSFGRIENFRDAEVEHLDRAVRSNLDVGRFQIAMDDTLLMGRFECVGDLPGEPQGLFQRQRAGGKTILQRRPVDQLENQRGSTL